MKRETFLQQIGDHEKGDFPFERIFLLHAFLGVIFSQLTEIQASNLISQKDIEAVVCGVPEKKGIMSLHVDCDRNNQSSRIAF